MKTLTILFIVTSHSIIGNTEKPTGMWFEELTSPYYAFVDAGYGVDIASINGGKVPIDPNSQKEVGKNPETVERFLKDKIAIKKLNESSKIGDVDAKKYAAVFLPGGHGTMWDFPDNKILSSIVSDTLSDGRVVATVCHGAAGLVNAKFANGEFVVKGKKISSFTDDEEEAAGLTGVVPFPLESRLREAGADIHKVPNFQPFAIADGNLITGQNPASSEKVAGLVIENLKKLK